METFEICHKVNNYLLAGDEVNAREELIRLLNTLESHGEEYDPLINHLIRLTGLYPYINVDTADWSDKYVCEVFKVDTGVENLTLHREQSNLLRMLLDGENIAVSAPTSFGKSFVIDAFIAIKKPINVVIIVPTIALTDETRRRIYKKFSAEYKIITTTDVDMADKNIFIFPQERALSYVSRINSIDMLVIDEFYKASSKYDGERSASLLKAMLKLGAKAKQKYYLAPNIREITDNVFTKDMRFVDTLNFSTVVLDIHNVYLEFTGDKDTTEKLKKQKLIELLKCKGKSLVYAASYPQIDKISKLLNDNIDEVNSNLAQSFSGWLSVNYGKDWELVELVKRGVGIHNGQLHRSISQLEIKLFDEHNDGLNAIISTSSIIEGVNTSAENVIIWKNKMSGGNSKLNSFTYKNIIGRGGRMFKYFIGNVYLLEPPPEDKFDSLEIPFPDSILGDIDEVVHKDSLNEEQVKKIIIYKTEMIQILGKETFYELFNNNAFQSNDSDFILKIAKEMRSTPHEWNGLLFFNNPDPSKWDRLLWKMISLKKGQWGDGAWGEQHRKFIAFVKILSDNWTMTIPQLLEDMREHGINIYDFFKLERTVTFQLSAMISDINILYKAIVSDTVDVSYPLSEVHISMF